MLSYLASYGMGDIQDRKFGFFSLGIECACAFATALINVGIFLIILNIFDYNRIHHSTIIAAGLCYVCPIFCPWYNSHLYLGQGSPVSWHSPTNFITKPFAILSFFLLLELIKDCEARNKLNRQNLVWFIIVTTLSVLAKPSYVQGIVVGLGLFIILRLLITRFNTLRGYFLLCLSFLPAAIVIVWQKFFVLGEIRTTAIGWCVDKPYTPNPYISLLLVVLFPFLYTAFNIRRLIKAFDIQLLWIYTLSAWLQSCLLYFKETVNCGDYGWASLIAYTILWIYTSVRFFMEWQNDSHIKLIERVKNYLLLFVWIMHFASGCYYVFQLITVELMWI